MVSDLFKRLAVLAVVAVSASCTGGGSGTPVFPIIGDDPEGLVSTMEWGDSPAIDPMPEERPVVVVLDSSTPEVARIAVEGGSCPPTAQVQVSGTPEAVRIAMVLGGSIEQTGIVCSEDPTTHELIVRFEAPIDLEGLEVSGRYTERAGAG